MVKILKESTLKKFYEESIKNHKDVKEGLIESVNKEYKIILKKHSIGKVLDLGYGYGNYTIESAKKGLKVTAIDYINKAYLKHRIKKTAYGKNIKILKRNLKSYTLKDIFDII